MKHKHARTLIYIEATGKYQAVCSECGKTGKPQEDKAEALREPLRRAPAKDQAA